MKNFLKKWFGPKRSRPNSSRRYRKVKRLLKRTSLRIQRRLPRKKKRSQTPNRKKLDFESLTARTALIRWVLILIALYLGAEMTARVIGVVH